MELILQVVDAASTPLLALICWIVWRIKTNDLPHIHDEVRDVGERVSRLEGGFNARMAGKK
jgi:hypothetical protein